MPIKVWTESELSYMRAHYKDTSLMDMGFHLHVAASTVRDKLHAMGLETDPNRKRRRVWSEEELAYLRENFAHVSAGDIADRMGVSNTTVSNKARELGLTKAPGWTKKSYQYRYVNRYSGR